MHTFQVHQVITATSPLPEMDSQVVFQQLAQGGSFEAQSASKMNYVRTSHTNPFVQAVHSAYNDHRPLAFGPDHIWLCIIQGIATHIEQNAEELRHHFVEHDGKEIIRIHRDQFTKGSPDNDWEEAFDEFSERIGAYIGKKHDLLVPSFSTTTPLESAIFNISLMDAMKHYFTFICRTMCGFPSITLEGTPEDWRSIKTRVQTLAEFDLEWWTNELIPVLDHFIATSEGRPNTFFWQRFYKDSGGSGGPYVTGWINTLFPYLVSRKQKFKNSYMDGWKQDLGGWSGPNPGNFPIGLSSTPFIWEYYQAEIPMEIVAGFSGVEQSENLTLRPAMGWGVRETENNK